jgi:uncharacterized protein YndB with AHSA1/START domain
MSNEPVIITQRFAASKADLFKAWTDESALKAWWQPAGKKLSSVENSLEDGGKVTYTFEPDGKDDTRLVIEGEYQEVQPEEKLVYTWNWILDETALENGNYLLTVEFNEIDEEAELTIHQESESEVEGVHPHKEGWEDALKSLENYLTKQ